MNFDFSLMQNIDKKMYQEAIQHYVLQVVGFHKFIKFQNMTIILEPTNDKNDSIEFGADLISLQKGQTFDLSIPHGDTTPLRSRVFISDISGERIFMQNMLRICHELAHQILYLIYAEQKDTQGNNLAVSLVHTNVDNVFAIHFYHNWHYWTFYGRDIRQFIK